MRVYLISRPSIDIEEICAFAKDEGLNDETLLSDGEEGDMGTPGTEAQYLVEMCGRLCYMSYGKGRKTNREFIANIIKSKHFSVLEHANWTFVITGVSRTLTHELVRHRHFSYSQLSQRYVDESDVTIVVPPGIKDDGSEMLLLTLARDAKIVYKELVDRLSEYSEYKELPATERRKAVRQAARSVLLNATETKIAVTGNARAWLEFFEKRESPFADPEIQELANMIHGKLQTEAPFIFGPIA